MSQSDPRERRARAFALMRRNRTREQARLTPEARVAFAEELGRWGALAVLPPGAKVRSTDESIQLWREVRARLRVAGRTC